MPTQPDFAAVDLDRVVSHNVLQDQRRCPSGDRQTIRLDPIVKMIRGDDSTGTGHVLDDPCRVAREILADMAGEQPGILIVGAAG